MLFLGIEGADSLISSNPPCKDGNAFSDQVWIILIIIFIIIFNWKFSIKATRAVLLQEKNKGIIGIKYFLTGKKTENIFHIIDEIKVSFLIMHWGCQPGVYGQLRFPETLHPGSPAYRNH